MAKRERICDTSAIQRLPRDRREASNTASTKRRLRVVESRFTEGVRTVSQSGPQSIKRYDEPGGLRWGQRSYFPFSRKWTVPYEQYFLPSSKHNGQRRNGWRIRSPQTSGSAETRSVP